MEILHWGVFFPKGEVDPGYPFTWTILYEANFSGGKFNPGPFFRGLGSRIVICSQRPDTRNEQLRVHVSMSGVSLCYNNESHGQYFMNIEKPNVLSYIYVAVQSSYL